jgi:hypothetical protein
MEPKSHAEVYIIESLDFDDEGERKEGEILSRTLTLSGKKPIYRYVRTKQEFNHFLDDFVRSKYRYLHISCHGNVDLIGLTLDQYDYDEFVTNVANALNDRRLFISSCKTVTDRFATKLFTASTCMSLAGPKKSINFDSAAVFWSTFYHMMFMKDSARMTRDDIAKTMLIVSWALAEPFNLFIRTGKGKHKHYALPSDKMLDKRLDDLVEL